MVTNWSMHFSVAECCLFRDNTKAKSHDKGHHAHAPPVWCFLSSPEHINSLSTSHRQFTPEARSNTYLWVTTSVWITATADSSDNKKTDTSFMSRLLNRNTAVIDCLRIFRFAITNYLDWLHIDEFDDCWVNKEKQNKLHLSITLNYSVDLTALKYIVLWLIEQYTFSYKYKSVL